MISRFIIKGVRCSVGRYLAGKRHSKRFRLAQNSTLLTSDYLGRVTNVCIYLYVSFPSELGEIYIYNRYIRQADLKSTHVLVKKFVSKLKTLSLFLALLLLSALTSRTQAAPRPF